MKEETEDWGWAKPGELPDHIEISDGYLEVGTKFETPKFDDDVYEVSEIDTENGRVVISWYEDGEMVTNEYMVGDVVKYFNDRDWVKL